MTTKDVLALALEALEALHYDKGTINQQNALAIEAITAIKQAQEPTIDYTVLHQFADQQGISYNKLCTAVQMCLIHPAPKQAQEPVEQRCQLCKYEYGHSIGCENNPVDIAIKDNTAKHKPTGWVAPVDRYAAPVLFNPYTGEPRDVRDVQSDPQGILIVPIGHVEMVAAAPKQAEPSWQPIESAPKDMGTYLFFCNRVAIQGFRDATGMLNVCIEAGANGNPPWRLMRRKPTHWMPLPTPPEAK